MNNKSTLIFFQNLTQQLKWDVIKRIHRVRSREDIKLYSFHSAVVVILCNSLLGDALCTTPQCGSLAPEDLYQELVLDPLVKKAQIK